MPGPAAEPHGTPDCSYLHPYVKHIDRNREIGIPLGPNLLLRSLSTSFDVGLFGHLPVTFSSYIRYHACHFASTTESGRISPNLVTVFISTFVIVGLF